MGGTFAGDRRKAANVEGRDLVTLDLDHIPAGQMEDILRRVEGLGQLLFGQPVCVRGL